MVSTLEQSPGVRSGDRGRLSRGELFRVFLLRSPGVHAWDEERLISKSPINGALSGLSSFSPRRKRLGYRKRHDEIRSPLV